MINEEKVLDKLSDIIDVLNECYDDVESIKQQYQSENLDKVSNNLSEVQGALDTTSKLVGEFIGKYLGHLLSPKGD